MRRTLPAPDMDERIRRLNERIRANRDRPSDYYEIHHWYCEARPYLDDKMRQLCKRLGSPRELHIHHVAGHSKNDKYCEVPGNWISVSEQVHNLFHHYVPKIPQFVFCAWIKTRKGEADWSCWQNLEAKFRVTALDSDQFIEMCGEWPVIDRMRRELIEQV